LAAELKRRFEHKYATTNCGALLVKFGWQDNMMKCKRLSGEVAAMLADIVGEGYLELCLTAINISTNFPHVGRALG
jgi:hypothetical protein